MVFWFKKNNNTGSAILIVVFLMSVLSICCMIFWQKSILFYNISIKRLEYEQKYRAASCGLEYAISVCAKNQDDQNSYFMETEEFEISDNIKYKCKIYINKNGEKVLNLRSVLCIISYFSILGGGNKLKVLFLY